jgi:hypothetical protein
MEESVIANNIKYRLGCLIDFGLWLKQIRLSINFAFRFIWWLRNDSFRESTRVNFIWETNSSRSTKGAETCCNWTRKGRKRKEETLFIPNCSYYYLWNSCNWSRLRSEDSSEYIIRRILWWLLIGVLRVRRYVEWSCSIYAQIS